MIAIMTATNNHRFGLPDPGGACSGPADLRGRVQFQAAASRRRHNRRRSDQPINEARSKTNTGLSKTPAATISHCIQIGTLPIRDLRVAPPGRYCARDG